MIMLPLRSLVCSWLAVSNYRRPSGKQAMLLDRKWSPEGRVQFKAVWCVLWGYGTQGTEAGCFLVVFRASWPP